MANTKKFAHSKLRNTGLLFEFLVRQLSNDILNNKKSPASNIIRKYFSNTELMQEYLLYQTIFKANNLSEVKADTLINSVLTSYSKLDTKKIKESKYNLVKEIKESFNEEDFFKSNVPSYRINATIYSLFELSNESKSVDPHQLIKVRTNLLEHLGSVPKTVVDSEWNSLDKGTKNLTLKVMVENFNKTFSTFDARQKYIINEYIKTVSNTNTLKPILNKALLEVKVGLIEQYKLVTDKITKIKLKQTINNIVPIKEDHNIKESDVERTLSYCNLLNNLTTVHEIN